MYEFLKKLSKGEIEDPELFYDEYGMGIYDRPLRSPLASYRQPIVDEMQDDSIYKIRIRHPEYIKDWLKHQRVIRSGFGRKRRFRWKWLAQQ